MSDSESYSEPDAVVISRDDVSDYNPKQLLPVKPEEIYKIREWLQPTSYTIAGGEFRKHASSYAQGTGQWLTGTSEYETWLNGTENGLLWIKGIPGSGKSVHAARIISELKMMSDGCPVLFFFFRQIIAANHQPQALLRDWMDQVLLHSPPLQHILLTYVEEHKSLGSFSASDMIKDLQTAFRNLPSKVFCVADALDEMDAGNDAFLEAIGSLGQWMPDKVKVLITSRPVPRVELPLRTMPALHVRLEERLVDADIATFVRSTLAASSIPSDRWQSIASAVPGRANGLFLYAKLAMDAFLEPGADTRTVLSNLPADLNVLYTSLLEEHVQRSGVSPTLQRLILQCVTHTTRPLRLLELAELCRTVDKTNAGRDLQAAKSLVKSACGSLLEILPDETVSVVHHSFTEYLKGSTRGEGDGGYPALQPGPAHGQLALACLDYMLVTKCLEEVRVSIDDTDDQPARTEYGDFEPRQTTRQILDLRFKYPLFEYVTRNWYIHVQQCEAHSFDPHEIHAILDKFLGTDKILKAWLEVTWPRALLNARNFTVLHAAARAGLIGYTRKLIMDSGMDVDACDVSGKTPLWWAACQGHSAVVLELLAAGADPSRPESVDGQRPLHEAAEHNHHAVVKVLLEAGVDPMMWRGSSTRESPDSTWEARDKRKPAVAYACEYGHVETLDVFLPFTDLETLQGCLAWAAQHGQVRIVSRILSHPEIDVNAMVRSTTALFRACVFSKDVAIVRSLLKAGAEPDVMSRYPDNYYSARDIYSAPEPKTNAPQYSSLQGLCGIPGVGFDIENEYEGDCCEIVRLFIEVGVGLDHQSEGDGTTALHSIVSESYSIASMLIDAGASVHVKDARGQTPLFKAGYGDCVRLLVENGADIDAQDNQGNTPLISALSQYYGQSSQIMTLLECGADAKRVNWAGDNALHLAVKSKTATTDVVEALLRSGIDPNKRNRRGRTALLALKGNESEMAAIRDLLLEAGGNINDQDETGQTIFWHQVLRTESDRHGSSTKMYELSIEDLQALIAKGADPKIRNYRGRTCLFEVIRGYCIAEMMNDTSRFDFLLTLGLDCRAVDHDGNTLLHELAAGLALRYGRYHDWLYPFWKRLVCNHGLDVNHQNHLGQTPLHILCDHEYRYESRHSFKDNIIDFILERIRDIDAADRHGMTALHLASTRAEFSVWKLLEAGADPKKTTNHGFTPLHCAARAQNTNIVGMLVQALDASSTGLDESNRDLPTQRQEVTTQGNAGGRDDLHQKAIHRHIDGIDALDAKGYTPLYHAVRSGRPETVSILLELGASVDVVRNDLYRACSEFEYEDERRLAEIRIAMDPLTQRDFEDGESSTMSAYGATSPGSDLGYRLTSRVTTRLEEILDMLVQFGADDSSLDRPAHYPHKLSLLEECILAGKSYTASCLLQVDKSCSDTKQKDIIIAPVSAPEYHHALCSSSFFDQVAYGCAHCDRYYFQTFIRRRQYLLVEELVRRGAGFLCEPGERCGPSPFTLLIQEGFSKLLKTVGRVLADRELGKGHWHAFGDSSKPGLWYANRSDESKAQSEASLPLEPDQNPVPEPFLLVAVTRDLPNLDIVKMLIQDFGIDVNETWGDEPRSEQSALHCVARGTHWWQVHQALRYLLDQVPELDINLKVRGGVTPLHVAAGKDSYCYSLSAGPHAYYAARYLVHAGADIHATADDGETCLSSASSFGDDRTVKLLLKHGAKITSRDIKAAVTYGRFSTMKLLLSHLPKNGDGHIVGVSLDPALLTVGHFFCKHGNSWVKFPDTMTLDVAMEMLHLLIKHGADCFAKWIPWSYRDPHDRFREIRHAHFLKDGPLPSSVPDKGTEMTLLHYLVMNIGDLPIPAFLAPGFDVDCRDAKGYTLLHAACNRSCRPWNPADETGETVFQHFVALGADLNTKNQVGDTILTSMLSSVSYESRPSAWKETIEELVHLAPELLHQPGSRGETPLLLSLHRATGRLELDMAYYLLSAGASPLTTTQDGRGVLHILAIDVDKTQLRELYRHLVKLGANINLRADNGQTPLFEFARRSWGNTNPNLSWEYLNPRNRHQESDEPPESAAIRMFQELGADFSVRDHEGRTLLHLAAEAGVARFRELMATGIDPLTENNAHQTAIDIAAACDNKPILEIFESKIKR